MPASSPPTNQVTLNITLLKKNYDDFYSMDIEANNPSVSFSIMTHLLVNSSPPKS